MDSFLMKNKFTFTTVYNKDKRVVRRCCDGEENVNRREKKLLVDATHLPNKWIKPLFLSLSYSTHKSISYVMRL